MLTTIDFMFSPFYRLIHLNSAKAEPSTPILNNSAGLANLNLGGRINNAAGSHQVDMAGKIPGIAWSYRRKTE
jgi:hypothetical protein